jgi:hypothetical protein
MSMGAVGQQVTRITIHGDDSAAAAQAYGQSGDGVSSWGDDGLFGMFASAYAECRQITAAALSGLSGEIGATGESLHTVVRNMGDTELANTEGLGRIWG